MKIKRLVILAGVLASFGASAQMPYVILDIPDTGRKTAIQEQAGKRLELLLRCKAGTTFTAQAVEAQFQALGLVKSVDGFFLPLLKGVQPSLFGDQVLAALVSDADGEKKVVVYLKKQTGKQMAKKLGVTKIDEQANTDDSSYFKQTSKKTTLLVGSASEVFLGNTSIKYQSAVTCQLIQ